jgi:hypothetical protein
MHEATAIRHALMEGLNVIIEQVLMIRNFKYQSTKAPVIYRKTQNHPYWPIAKQVSCILRDKA